MKNLTLTSLIVISATITTFSQTNRINHYSHSGSNSTLDIFSSKDNMGCGEALRGEYVPDTTQKPMIKIEKVDTTKQSLNKLIEIPENKKPRKGMSFDTQINTRQPHKKVN
jgi:hypothetical protein